MFLSGAVGESGGVQDGIGERVVVGSVCVDGWWVTVSIALCPRGSGCIFGGGGES